MKCGMSFLKKRQPTLADDINMTLLLIYEKREIIIVEIV